MKQAKGGRKEDATKATRFDRSLIRIFVGQRNRSVRRRFSVASVFAKLKEKGAEEEGKHRRKGVTRT